MRARIPVALLVAAVAAPAATLAPDARSDPAASAHDAAFGHAAASRHAAARQAAEDPPVLLRLRADSGVVGHYRIQSSEVQGLTYDIPDDDPRMELLGSVTGPWHRATDVALTMVVGDQTSEDVQRFILYLLGYKVTGDEVRSLTPAQWDSIFQEVGRQAVLNVSPVSEVRGVQVAGEAVRPVGQALAGILGGIALRLPADSVTIGSSWSGRADVPVRRPDGSRTQGLIAVTYRLTAITQETTGRFARIEFDGVPQAVADSATDISGRYFGEALFAIEAGRYEQVVAEAELEVGWPGSESGLPPSRSHVQWQATFSRVLGGSG